MPYSNDTDLLKHQKSILDYGVSTWVDQQAEAESLINRDIELKWYRPIAAQNSNSADFDAALILDQTQLNRLSIYKTLFLAYVFLMHDDPKNEPHENKRNLYKGFYEDELNILIENGIKYDWDGSGDVNQAVILLGESKLQRTSKRWA